MSAFEIGDRACSRFWFPMFCVWSHCQPSYLNKPNGLCFVNKMDYFLLIFSWPPSLSVWDGTSYYQQKTAGIRDYTNRDEWFCTDFCSKKKRKNTSKQSTISGDTLGLVSTSPMNFEKATEWHQELHMVYISNLHLKQLASKIAPLQTKNVYIIVYIR